MFLVQHTVECFLRFEVFASSVSLHYKGSFGEKQRCWALGVYVIYSLEAPYGKASTCSQ